MYEKKTLVCVPVSRRGYVTPGSLQDKCSKCGQLVWIAPSSWLILHDNPGTEILCMPCTLMGIEKDKDFKIEDITLAQAEEFNEYLEGRK